MPHIVNFDLYEVHFTPLNTQFLKHLKLIEGGEDYGKSKKYGIKNLHFRRYRSYGG